MFDGLPALLRIGSYDVTIVIVDQMPDGSNDFGEFSYNRSVITLRKLQPTPAFGVDTLLHEIVHAIHSFYDIKSKKDDEERVACRLGAALTQIFRDNPQLLTWIAKSLGSDTLPK